LFKLLKNNNLVIKKGSKLTQHFDFLNFNCDIIGAKKISLAFFPLVFSPLNTMEKVSNPKKIS